MFMFYSDTFIYLFSNPGSIYDTSVKLGFLTQLCKTQTFIFFLKVGLYAFLKETFMICCLLNTGLLRFLKSPTFTVS